ncbi:MAG: cobalt ECF transporter T component CbiQ [Candidatus Omnitrophica bacterium]|nr:cobalt ECF transporter T component CbiQ [Candidatus Omnitrophota bacterium]
MHLPEIDKYSNLNSFFHSWDPRVKIISFSILIIVIALLPNITPAAIAFLMASVLLILSKIPVIFVLKQLRWVFFIIFFFLIVMPFTVPGDAMLRLGLLTASQKGFDLAVLIALRAVSMVIIIFPMFGTSEFHRSLKALQKLKVPNKIIQMIMFAYRYIFVFLEMLSRMLTAARARLFNRRTDMFTLRTIGNLTGMLFVRGYEKTERIYQAMQSRGYTGSLSIQDEFRLTGKDFAKAFLIIGMSVLLNITGICLCP